MKLTSVIATISSLFRTSDAYNFGSPSRVVDVTSRREALSSAFSVSALVGSVIAGPAPAFAGSLSQLVRSE